MSASEAKSVTARPGRSFRGIIAGFLIALGITGLVAGVTLAYSWRALFNSAAFADRVAASLGDPGVAGLIADRVTAAVIANNRDLTAFGPIISGTTRQIVSSEPFRAIVRRAARAAHETLMSGRAETMALNLSDVGVILKSALAGHPELAKRIPAQVTALVGDVKDAPGGRIALNFLRVARRSRLRTLALLGASLALIGLGLALSTKRRRSLFRLGLSLAIIALLLRLTVRFGGTILSKLARDPSAGLAVAGLWGAFLGGFMVWALVLGLIGLVLVAAVHSLFERVQVGEVSRSVWRWFTAPPSGKGAWALRGVVLMFIGAFMSLTPSATLTVLSFLAGLVVFFVGLRELFGLLLRSLPQFEPRKGAKAPAPGEAGLSWGRVLAVGLPAVLIIGLGVVVLTNRAETAAAPVTITACNGYPELADRRLDRVVFPGTHNSMSAADMGWLNPNHEKGIISQLNDGVRALLIDVHFGVPVEGRVKTLVENEEVARKKYEAVLGKDGIEAALRIRDRMVGKETGKRDVYLCHGFCELGENLFVPMLEQIRQFLVANPSEVIIICIQDEGVMPEDLERSFEASRLIDFVYRGPAAPPWPTLREMVASDQRVVVMTENNSSPAVPWIHPAFGVMQETPYSFRTPADFSCRPNRGGRAGSLYLMNHWIESAPSKPSNAEIVNAYDLLLARARTFEKERGHLPNVIAVDFYKTGDLFEVARTLNGVGTPRPPVGGR